MSNLEIERENLSTKVDEANQTVGALRFQNNSFNKKAKKLDEELFQVHTQLKRTSSAMLDEMLSFQKSSLDTTSLGYVPSTSFQFSHKPVCHDVFLSFT